MVFPPYAMLKDQTNIINREHFKLTSCCNIGTQWIKNRERRIKNGVGKLTTATTYKFIFCVCIFPTSLFHEINIKALSTQKTALDIVTKLGEV